MASRLTEQSNVTVAVVEAGTWAENVVGNLTEVPGYDFTFDVKAENATITAVDWGFLTTPQQGITGQPILRYPRGKALGGSTNLNAMAWGESSRGVFAKWADEVGDDSWQYDNVHKYYNKATNFTPPDLSTRWANATPTYDPALIVTGGPLDVSYGAYAYSWTTWLAVALDGIGIKNTNSFITGELNGSAWQQHTINHTTGFRASADRGYLRPFLHRPNLVVIDSTLGERVLFDADKRATGIEVTTANVTYTLNATREVIVSGGVFQSPQLLQVSGVGPAALLESHGIPVVADRPGVGQNLDDQILFGVSYRVNVPTLSTIGSPDYTAGDVELFNTNATGRLTSPGGEYVGYEKVPQELRSGFSPDTVKALDALPSDWPEIEYLTLPAFVGDFSGTPPPEDGYDYATLIGTLLSQTSRGNVSISSARMSDPPLINPNWLTTQADIEVSVAMFKRLRQAWAVPALAANLTIGEEYYPGPSVQTDAEIEALIRRTMTPVSHASATCKMGKEGDQMAVVDSHGKVFGVRNLRVVDASAFPFLPPGSAPQAAVYMLAEKIADDVKNGL
ncbi:MAG: hypothetical protein Q9219_001698 [cf. Caloplaca sp. 3 TL-2023]